MFQPSYGTEVNIHTLASIKYMPHGVIQYWIDTSYLPYNACMDKLNQQECNGSVKGEGSSSSTPFQSIESEEADKYYETQSCNDNSSSTSVDTAAYILSNLNTTNKVDTMAIVEGAKHNTEMNRQNEKCDKIGSTGSDTNKIPENNRDENILDSNDNCCSIMCSLKTLTHGTEQANNNTENGINRDDVSALDTKSSETEIEDKKKEKSCTKESLTALHTEQVSLIADKSTSKATTFKLSHRKKLYTGRDSPVDLVLTTTNTGTSMFEAKSNLHPALETNFKTPKSTKVYKKRKTAHLGLLCKRLNKSRLSPQVLKRRRPIRSCYNNVTTSPESTKSGNLFPVSIVNNLTEKENPAKSTDEQCMDITLSIDTLINMNCNAEINSTIQTEEPNDKEQHKMFNNEKRILVNLKPKVYLKRLSESSIQKYKKRKKTKTDCECLNPVVCLKRLSKSDIQKFKKAKEMILSELSDLGSTVEVENQLAGSDIQKHKDPKLDTRKNGKSHKVLDICLDPIVRLEKLSESDLKLYTHDVSPSDNSESTIINMLDDSQSDKSTVLIVGCHSSDRDSLSTSSCSVKTIRIASPLANISNGHNFNNKNGLNKENRELNYITLHKKSKMQRKEYYTCNETNLFTTLSKLSTRRKTYRGWKSDISERSYKDGCSSSINTRKHRKARCQKPRVILSVEDDSFKKLIHDFKFKENFEDLDRTELSNIINNSRLNDAEKPGADRSFRQPITNYIKFRKQRHFDESGNDATRLQLNTRSSESVSISKKRKQVLTNANNATIKSTVLRFQTKLFVDSDSESSYVA